MMFGIGDISRAFMGLGSGVAHGIGGLGRKIKKLGEADDSPPASLTAGGFNQSAGGQDRIGDISPRIVEDAVAAAENNARDEFGDDGGLPDLPLRRDLPITAPIPTPRPAPSFNSLVPSPTTLPDLSPMRRVTPGMPTSAPSLVGPSPSAPDFDRRNMPIPALPGHAGGPVPYNSADAAKYDYTMAGANRDAEGNLTSGFKRDWKQSALASLAGAARGYATTGDIGGAIGGAAAGAGGSLISPQAGREFNFDTLYRPEIESREARERATQERANMEIVNRAKLEDLRAETDERRARTRKLGEPTPRTVNLKVGINRRTGKRANFDANDPAQLALHDPEPAKSTGRGQMRLGRNINTGELDYYDPSDPEQAAQFKPDRLPPSSDGKPARPPGGVLKQIGEIKKLRRAAQNAWDVWGKENDPKKREDARIAASEAQARYNDEVAALGEAFPDVYEVGGFTESNGNQGWGYYKPREDRGQAQPRGGKGAARPSVYKRNVNELPPLR